MTMKIKIKKLISVVVAVVIVVMTMAPMSLAAVTYPQNITKEQALSVIEKTDTVVASVLRQTQNTTLKELVLREICSSQVLSMLLTEIYKAIEANSESLSVLNLNISPSSVASFLSDYPEVQQALQSCSTWAEVNLENVSWGINDKPGFVDAVAAFFGPFNDLLYTLLCDGSYPLILVVGIKGAMGYENAIVPILKNLGCQRITDNETFCTDAGNDRFSMVRHILYDLFNFIEGVLDAPCSRLTDILPGIAHFINNNGLQNAITTLVSPLKVQVLNIPLPIEIDTFVSADQVSQGFTFDFNLGELGSVSGFKTAEIDLELIASCGTVQGDTVVSDKADTFICVLRWIIETLKLNEQTLTQGVGGQVEADVLSMLSTLINKPTDDIIAVLIELLNQTTALTNNYTWTFNQNPKAQVSYTQNLGQDKFQRVLDGVDELINEFVKEGGQADKIEQVLLPEIYSNKTVSTLAKEFYKALSDEAVAEVMGLLDIRTAPADLARLLNEKQFSHAAEQLSQCSSWEQVNAENLNWGIKAGNEKQFINAVAAAFRPFDKMLKMLLAGGNVRIFDSIDIYGSDGYNTAIIPVLEALGVYIDSIPLYNEYVNQVASEDAMKPIVRSLCSLINRIAEKPVYTITEILPNLLYFVNNGGIEIIVENLMYPLSFYLDKLGVSELLDTSEFTGVLNIKKMINDFMQNPELGVKLPELELDQFQGMGELTSVVSKRTMSGSQISIYAVKADQTAVIVTLMRYIVSVIKAPGNENLLSSFISSSEEMGGEMLTSFLSNLNEQINAMTVDETVEWLYDIFFAETVVVPDEPQEEYDPTIIYEDTEETVIESSFDIIVIALIVIAGIEILCIRNKNRISNYTSKKKENKKIGNKEV